MRDARLLTVLQREDNLRAKSIDSYEDADTSGCLILVAVRHVGGMATMLATVKSLIIKIS